MRIAIQGFTGSFHAMAAEKLYGNTHDLVMCDSFINLFKSLERKEADLAIMAIENTIAGTILFNYSLLKHSQFKIIGETFLRIEHALLAMPGQSIDDIVEVRTHPMAIMQCTKFFAKYPHVKLIEDKDTALIAEQIANNKSLGLAAVADKSVASIFGLEVLHQNIEDTDKNFTRFLVLSPVSDQNEIVDSNKATLSFSVTHEIGALSHVLNCMSENGLNITTIQSTPYIGNEWEYFFHTDVEFNTIAQFEHTLTQLRSYTTSIQVLGKYKKGI